jgi:hypothetical protein
LLKEFKVQSNDRGKQSSDRAADLAKVSKSYRLAPPGNGPFEPKQVAAMAERQLKAMPPSTPESRALYANYMRIPKIPK